MPSVSFMCMVTRTSAFSGTLQPGAGITAGEILKSLWSTLNSISPTVHTATLTHHAEVLYDHAFDSNHKKLIRMTGYLCHKYHDAMITLKHAKNNFKGQLDVAGQLATQV